MLQLSVEGDWNCKISQKLQCLFFFKKKEMGLSKTGMKVLWNAKCSKLPVGSDWTCKTSQNVQVLGFFETEVGLWKKCFQI